MWNKVLDICGTKFYTVLRFLENVLSFKKKVFIMSNAITNAYSLDQVVEIINQSNAGHSSPYFGGSDTRDAEDMAAQYAFDASVENGYFDDDSVSAQLDFLVQAGAEFDFSLALEKALSRKKL